MTTTLNFDFLDDLMIARVRKGVDCSPYLSDANVGRIGPLLELLIQNRSKPNGFDALPSVMEVTALRQALDKHAPASGVHLQSRQGEVSAGFVVSSRDPTADDQAPWYSFCLKAQQAAERGGIKKPIARGLIGAIREIEENIHKHSGRAHDGVVGYRATDREFEFLIGDSGIGTLASLRQNHKYAELTDAGRSLELALTDGVSRLGDDIGHGVGFRELFVGLANLDGELRFRSGDHALTIDGTAPSLLERRLLQKTELQGFVASIVCRA